MTTTSAQSAHATIVPEAVPVKAEAFRTIFRHHPGGTALITAHANGRHAAMTVSSLSSVSTEPPMVMFSVSVQSSSAPILAESETVAVHMIDADRLELAKIGATSGIDRFAEEHRWVALPSGERVFPEAPIWFRARIERRIDVGGSTVCIARVLESNVPEDPEAVARGAELVYVNRAWHRLLGARSRIG